MQNQSDQFLVSVRISGADAATFLQSQLTSDVMALEPGQAQASAYLTPKGRVITSLVLLRQGADFLAIVPQSLHAALFQRLRMFVLRSKVEFAEDNSTVCFSTRSDTMRPETVFLGKLETTVDQDKVCITLPNGGQLGLLSDGDAPEQTNTRSFWDFRNIMSGFAWIDASQSERFTPHMLSYQSNGVVNFRKGCYPGQEIVARTQYLGASKRELVQITHPSESEFNAFLTANSDILEIVTSATSANLPVCAALAVGQISKLRELATDDLEIRAVHSES